MHRNQPYNTNSISLVILAGIIVGLIAIKPVFSFAAFQEPNTNDIFPVYNTNTTSGPVIPDVLNGFGEAQQKKGTLQIGPFDAATCDTTPGSTNIAGCAKICLNPNIDGATTITTDTTNCVYSWGQLQAKNQATLPASGTLLSNDNATTSHGYVSLKNPTSTPSLGSDGYYGVMMTLMAEASKFSTSPAITATARTSTDYAAQFAGTLAASSGVCLNETVAGASTATGQYCIQYWSDIVATAVPTIVRLQNLNSAQDHPADNGSVNANGILVAGSLIGGVPPSGAPLAMTCGDGTCSVATESFANCPVDCHQ